MDWEEVLLLTPRDLDDHQKDELSANIKRIDIDEEDISFNDLKHFFKITQEVLKYKDEQLESLMSEFDEIARKQGIEEARLIQNLENEIKSLRSSSESRRQTPDIDVIKDNEELRSKIKQFKNNMKIQLQENEKLKKDILILQEEKILLQSELHSVNPDSDSQSEASVVSEKYNRLTDNLRQKNKQISHLLSDIEVAEKENTILKEKIVNLRDDLKEATEHVTRMTTEISGQNIILKENTEKIDSLSNENTALRIQIEDLVKQKQDRDNELDKFSVTLDSKVDELKKILEEKQLEIKELKQQNTEFNKRLSQYSNESNKIPASVLLEREEQIEELQVKLAEATLEIEKNTTLLNKIAETQKQTDNDSDRNLIIDDLKAQLLTAHERCQDLQNQLESTEQDAQNHSQQLSELLNQLRKYEEGQYGLSDALREIQEHRVQINIRDKQIADVIQTCNKLQSNCDEVEQENLALRAKLGLTLDAPVSKNGIISKQRKQKKLINNLQNQIEILEDEKLQIKVELQRCKRNDGVEKIEADKKHEEKSAIDHKKQLIELAEENEALRKGMHEILESIRAKNDSSSREIKSESLEQLLHILDVRHVSGWYHPAMRLQAELNTLQGINTELRTQLHITKSEASKSNEKLKQTEVKLEEIAKKVEETTNADKSKTKIDSSFISSLVVPPNISDTSAEIISKLNAHLLIVLNEYHNEVEDNEKLKEKIETTKQELNITRQQVGLLYKQHQTERKLLTTKYEEMRSDKQNLSQTIQLLQNKLQSLIKPSESNCDKNEIGAKLSNDLVSLNRKCLYLEENEKKISNEIIKLKAELCFARSASAEFIKDLEINRDNLVYKTSVLEKAIRESIPKNKLDNAKKTIYDLTITYKELLQNVNSFKENSNVIFYKKEIELLNSEKDKLFFELLQMKSKIYASVHSNDEINILTRKIANLELNELSERQRADHINSLYELVKDQLKKCEERCFEIENQNKTLLNANLKYQLAQQELQDKLMNCVTREECQCIEDKLSSVQEELQTIRNKYDKLLTRNHIIEAEIKTREMLQSNQNMELMNLKHLVLDLQSSSDDKALIARLSTEVVLARICESDAKNKVDILTNELQQTNDYRKNKEMLLEESYSKVNSMQNNFQMKLRIVEQIIHSIRMQYLGCTPLSTQERTIEMLQQIYTDKQNAFNDLQIVQKQKNDIIRLQEQLNIEIKNTLELKAALLREDSGSTYEKVLEWYKDKNTFQLNDFKLRRNLEIAESQLKQALQRNQKQDTQLAQLEEELLKTTNNFLNNSFITNLFPQIKNPPRKVSQDTSNITKTETAPEKSDVGTDPHFTPIKQTTSETQTNNSVEKKDNKSEEINSGLQEEIRQINLLITLKDNNIQRQESLIADFEKKVEILTAQLSEKQKQIVTQENVTRESRQQLNVIDEVDLAEHNALKNMVAKLQIMITQKEDVIAKYETLLKDGRDEHSLAASRFQDEIKQLQIALQQQQQQYEELKSVKSEPQTLDLLPNRTAIEQYVSQVHILEGHMADLQTSVSSLNSQLQASRQEAVRWRTLANDRLKSIESLQKEFDDQHSEEISTYKDEYEKCKEENISLKQELLKLRVELSQKSSNVVQQVQERDATIHELTMNVMQLKNELKIFTEDGKMELTPQVSELELAKQLLQSEYEALEKRFEQIQTREKSARDEIRSLKSQLIKRPILSVRTDRNDKSIKEQLQKKIVTLEKELAEANERLNKEAAFNEVRKVKIAEDFTLWEKQKRWQQTAEKSKEKLAIKTEELDKLQQSYSSAKSIISRLEREKHILEGKLKIAKQSSVTISSSRLESMEQENIHLKNDIDVLTAKLEMQQYHSGGLGAAMLQEKLEAQERKIAILELTAKGTVEVTAELERLNNSLSSLQKANLRLEAENLELSLDLKKATADAPYLKEQIQHLERYIEVLKSEQSEHHVVTNAGDQIQPGSKKVSELEKTVLSLKRLVEKLQAENKRLQSRPCSSSSSNADRKAPSDKLQVELKKIRDQYGESVQKSAKLEDELSKSQKRVRFLENVVGAKQIENESSITAELADVRAQLTHKTQLLEKVKILLQKAAVKEKFLQDQVIQLKQMTQTENIVEEENPEGNT